MTGYQSKRAMAQDKLDKAIEPNTITFHNLNSDWVMRITADRRIEVNEGVEVTEAAQKVLDALQHLLKPAQPEQEPQVCCGEYDTCLRACTPRGRHLAQLELEQEPVAWAHKEGLESIKDFDASIYANGGFDDAVPLYTTPQRTWVGLTEQQQSDIEDASEMMIGIVAFSLISDTLKANNT